MEDKYLAGMLKSKYCPDGITKLNISLEEYNNILNKFRSMSMTDGKTAYFLSIQAIAWQDWLLSILNSVGYIGKVIEADRNARIAEVCQTCGEKAMTKAEKIALRDETVMFMKKQKAITDAIYGVIDAKIKILDKIFYLCRAIALEEKGE